MSDFELNSKVHGRRQGFKESAKGGEIASKVSKQYGKNKIIVESSIWPRELRRAGVAIEASMHLAHMQKRLVA